MQPLGALEADVQRAFGERAAGRRLGDFSQSNAIDLVEMVLGKWSGATVKTESKQVRRDGGRKRVYTLTVARGPPRTLVADK